MKKCVLVLFFLILATSLYADVVYYKNGTKSVGKIIKQNKKIIIIKEIIEGTQCETEASLASVERIEKGPVPKPPLLSKEKIKKEPMVEPKKVSVPVVRFPVIEEESEQKKASVQEILVVKEIKTKEQENRVKQERMNQQAQQKKIVLQQAANEKAARQKKKNEAVLIQKTELTPKSRKLCQYSLVKHEDKTASFGNKITMCRVEVSVVVPNNVPFTQLRNLFTYLLRKERGENEILDAFWVSVYREAYGEEGIPMAYGIWAPPGGWDDFTQIQDKNKYQWQYRLIKR